MFAKLSKNKLLILNLDMKEVLNAVICHTNLEQYTTFNF